MGTPVTPQINAPTRAEAVLRRVPPAQGTPASSTSTKTAPTTPGHRRPVMNTLLKRPATTARKAADRQQTVASAVGRSSSQLPDAVRTAAGTGKPKLSFKHVERATVDHASALVTPPAKRRRVDEGQSQWRQQEPQQQQQDPSQQAPGTRLPAQASTQYLEGLNDVQRQAVLAPAAPLMIGKGWDGSRERGEWEGNGRTSVN